MFDPVLFHLPDNSHHLREYRKKRLIINGDIVPPDPFIDGYQMRGREEAHALAFRLQDRLQVRAHRSLPVSSRHMDDLAVKRRISKSP